MRQYMLRQGCLNDDYLNVANEKKVFKGGYIAILFYYTFLNAWCNKEHVVRFRTEAQLFKYLKKNYPDVFYDLDFSDTCLDN
jgi:hypothetical protein